MEGGKEALPKEEGLVFRVFMDGLFFLFWMFLFGEKGGDTLTGNQSATEKHFMGKFSAWFVGALWKLAAGMFRCIPPEAIGAF